MPSLAILEDAWAWRGSRLPRLVFLDRVGCSSYCAGGGLGLCVLHEPHARYGHREDEHAGYE
jgi:hypothetical protein